MNENRRNKFVPRAGPLQAKAKVKGEVERAIKSRAGPSCTATEVSSARVPQNVPQDVKFVPKPNEPSSQARRTLGRNGKLWQNSPVGAPSSKLHLSLSLYIYIYIYIPTPLPHEGRFPMRCLRRGGTELKKPASQTLLLYSLPGGATALKIVASRDTDYAEDCTHRQGTDPTENQG